MKPFKYLWVEHRSRYESIWIDYIKRLTAQRLMSHNVNTVLLGELQKFPLGKVGMTFDLIHCRDYCCNLQNPLRFENVEIR